MSRWWNIKCPGSWWGKNWPVSIKKKTSLVWKSMEPLDCVPPDTLAVGPPWGLGPGTRGLTLPFSFTFFHFLFLSFLYLLSFLWFLLLTNGSVRLLMRDHKASLTLLIPHEWGGLLWDFRVFFWQWGTPTSPCIWMWVSYSLLEYYFTIISSYTLLVYFSNQLLLGSQP